MTAAAALTAAKRLAGMGFDVRVSISHRRNARHSQASAPEQRVELAVPMTNYDDLDHLVQKRKELEDAGYRATWDGSSEFDIEVT